MDGAEGRGPLEVAILSHLGCLWLSILVMGVLIEGNLISTHRFKSMRRRAAIERKNLQIKEVQSKAHDMKHRVEQAYQEIALWEMWWNSSDDSAMISHTYGSPFLVDDDGAVPVLDYHQMSPKESRSGSTDLGPHDSGGGSAVRLMGVHTSEVAVQTDNKHVQFAVTEQSTQEMLEKVIEDQTGKMVEIMEEKIEERITQLTQTFAAKFDHMTTEKLALEKQVGDLRSKLARSEEARMALQADLDELTYQMKAGVSDAGDSVCDDGVSQCSEPQGFPPLSTMKARGDCGLVRNHMGFSMTSDDVVDWRRSLNGEMEQEFAAARAQKLLLCSMCRQDLIDLPGNCGLAMMTDDGDRWEQKCIIDLVVDGPLAARCHRCHFSTQPCMFESSASGCLRGDACAYRHVLQLSGPSSTDMPRSAMCCSGFLTYHDLVVVAAVSCTYRASARELAKLTTGFE